MEHYTELAEKQDLSGGGEVLDFAVKQMEREQRREEREREGKGIKGEGK